MTAATPDLVRRLYLRLLEEGGARLGDTTSRLTVGDLYQHLIPYRTVRSELGVFELAEYENALLRLLAGEGGYLRVADEGARGELAAELRSVNPILGIYRDYSSLPVELLESALPSKPVLSLHREERVEPPSTGLGSSDRPEEAEEPEPTAEPEPPLDAVRDVREFVAETFPEGLQPPRPLPADATRVARSTPPAPSRVEGGVEEHRCRFCDRPLPDVEGVRFCPHCGADQTSVPCQRCGTPVRAEWNFCIRCGARRPPEPESL